MRLIEVPHSQESKGNPSGVTVEYRLIGVQDASLARILAENSIAQTAITVQGIMQRGVLDIQPDGFEIYHITANYGPPGKLNLPVGGFTFSFDTTGGTVHIENSGPYDGRQAAYKAAWSSGNIPNTYNVIGWDQAENKIVGVDRVVPVLKFQVTVRHPIGLVSLPRIRTLARNSGTVNSDIFLGFEPGEVLFLGANGTEGTSTETEVTYHFEASENVKNLSIGDVLVVTKQGFDYAWIRYQKAEDSNSPVVRPEYVFIERIYKRVSLSLLLGFGA